MASAKDLRKRIGTVKNTQQITKAMKMVSAAKLRRAQENIMSLRPYAKELQKMILGLTQSLGDVDHPLLNEKEDVKSCLILLVSSDRGLCGGFNANIIKAAQRYQRTNGHKYKRMDFAYVGKKANDILKDKKPGKYWPNFFVKLDFKKSQGLAEELIELYKSGEYDEIKIVYNEFKSVISQKINVEQFLPVKEGLSDESGQSASDSTSTIYEPNAKDILNQLLPKHFSIQIHRVLLESLASEYAARMTAMENATKNAGEMIKKLSLIYNKTRQAGITKELLEIVSGAESLKG